jgi:hypothetical protein
MIDFTVIPVYMDEDADGTRTAQGGYLDSGKCPAYRGLWGRRRRHVRRRLGGYRDREQRVLRAPASGQRIGQCIGDEGLRHGKSVGNSDNADTHPDRQHIHLGGTYAYAHADTHHVAAYAYAHAHAD